MFNLKLEKENQSNDFVAVKDAWNEELAHAAKEKDEMPASVKDVQIKQFKMLKQQIRELQMRQTSLEIELCKREWSPSACLREKDALIRKFKQQLSLAAEREWILEQSKRQAVLDWQQLCENAESKWYQKAEDLTQSLSSAREQIFQCDDTSSVSKDTPTLEIKKLQEQNANLRAAVAQMRKEMESLDEQMMSPLPLTENRQLAEQGSLCTNKISTGTVMSNIKVSSTNLDYIVNPDTEKELQYAKQQHPSSISSLIACPSLKEEGAPSSCREETELPSTEVQLYFSIETRGPEQRKADTCSKIIQSQPFRQSPCQAQQIQLSSSRTHSFCQGIWQTLGVGSSPSALSSQKNTDQVEFEVMRSTEQPEESQQNIKSKDKLEMPAADLTVRGTRLEAQQKLKSRNLYCAHPIKPKISSNMAKIRNYNIKD